MTEGNRVPENWLPVPGFELRYAVSDHGRVYSFYKWKYLKPGYGNGGHAHVNLGRNNTRSVHELVLTAFVGSCPDGMEARHLNGVPNDNRLDNLKWDTRGANNLDRKHHHARGQLSVSEILAIKDDLARGGRPSYLARKYGVSPTTISHIRMGRSHAEVRA